MITQLGEAKLLASFILKGKFRHTMFSLIYYLYFVVKVVLSLGTVETRSDCAVGESLCRGACRWGIRLKVPCTLFLVAKYSNVLSFIFNYTKLRLNTVYHYQVLIKHSCPKNITTLLPQLG